MTAFQTPAQARKRVVRVALNGVTGRMGENQHLLRSVLAIRAEGGIQLDDGGSIWPEPILVGRDPEKLKALAARTGVGRWSTDLDTVLSDPDVGIYFDAQVTTQRPAAVRRAIAAGKHIYCEKPTAVSLQDALELARLAQAAGVKTGVVQDKLFLPGIRTLKRLLDDGFFGELLSVRGEFGYWVFPGPEPSPQRPSWNYRREDGGGIVLDMFCHWRYVIDNLFGPPVKVFCVKATHIPERIDEHGQPYKATADDAAYATFTLESGTVIQLNSSWATRVNRDELLEFHVDGTAGSAVAGLRYCKLQPVADTPRAVWNPDIDNPIAFRQHWRLAEQGAIDNAFKIQWELFLRHVATDDPFPWDLFEAAKGLQLAELAEQSATSGQMLEIPPLAYRR